MVTTIQLATTKPITELKTSLVEAKGRLDNLEKYGIYTSLADLKNAKVSNSPYYLSQ